jgi:hypothetical protein
MPCLPTTAPERHASTGSSRLTTSTQLSRPSSSWTSTDSSISISSSTLRALHQAVIPAIEGYLEHELSWYRNIEDWDFENSMVKIGPPLWRQRQKHDSIQAEAAEQVQQTEVEEAERTAQSAREKDDSMRAILTHLREQAGCSFKIQRAPNWLTDPVSKSSLSAEVRDLQQIVPQHRKHDQPIPAAKLSQRLNQIQNLVVLVDNYSETDQAKKDAAGLLLLRTAIYELIEDFECVIDPHRNCVVCGCRDKAGNFPSKTTSRCAHETNTCSPCLQKWIESQITDKGLKIKCVECPVLFEYKDIREHVSDEIFER